jgi:hypothetical protein
VSASINRASGEAVRVQPRLRDPGEDFAVVRDVPVDAPRSRTDPRDVVVELHTDCFQPGDDVEGWLRGVRVVVVHRVASNTEIAEVCYPPAGMLARCR